MLVAKLKTNLLFQRTLLVLLLASSSTILLAQEAGNATEDEVTPEDFIELLIGPLDSRVQKVQQIAQSWQPGFEKMLVEVLRFSRDPATRKAIENTLAEQTGQKEFGQDLDAWNEWIWSRPSTVPANYAEFKSLLYRNLDPKFADYFSNDRATTIRLDEVQWGGVVQDGIPPLHDPKMIEAEQAKYLGKKDVIFGVEINGDARAYPKRILAWHEMFTDTVGGVPVAGVYCTLCGSAVLYETNLDGVEYELGTSGFLYRSNKLMFDHATQSLWNTLWGRPAVGPLVEQNIQLRSRPIVTTRWAEWLERHPDTLVLSTDTGFDRDYSEGAAYRDYFATDELMFEVPTEDKRLKNKDEILALADEARTRTAALAADFLEKNPVYHHSLGDIQLVVLTDRSGANRVYQTSGQKFTRWNQEDQATDTSGGLWQVSEDGLAGPEGEVLPRYPAHRAFWFGWHAAYPDTELVR